MARAYGRQLLLPSQLPALLTGEITGRLLQAVPNTQPGAPLAYSEDPTSPFFQMVKHDYDISQTLTPDQTNDALFWRDIPGVSTAGHWVSILQQVLKQTNSHLDKAAFAYALTGACINDAGISVFKTKYTYNLVRPITYIRNVMGSLTKSFFE